MSFLAPIDVKALDREALPALLGEVVRLEAEIRLRLSEASATSRQEAPSRPLDLEEATVIAGCSRRWLLQKTKDKPFRNDITRKKVVFNEDGLRRWLAGRGR